MNSRRWLASSRWIFGLLAVGLWQPALADYSFCVRYPNGGALGEVLCGCPAADGHPTQRSCVVSDHACPISGFIPDGTCDCCYTGVSCQDEGAFWGTCPDDPGDCNPPGSACHSPSALCQEGICRQTPPTYNPQVVTYTGRASTYCDTSGGNSSCDKNKDHCSPCEGDPVNLAARTSRHDVTEFSIAGSIAPFALTRSYVSSEKTWAYEEILGTLTAPFVPKPFGSAPAWPASLRWWHELYSFIYPFGWTPGNSIWSFQEGDGSTTDFVACSNGTTSCFATPTTKATEATAKLYWQNTGGSNGYFIVFYPARRYVFQDIWMPPASGIQRFFLSRIEDAQYPLSGGSTRVVAQLSYALPNPSCPGQSAGQNPGVPYLSQVTTADGAQFTFQYRLVTTFRSSPTQECVLGSISVLDKSDGGTTPLVQYAYVTDGGVETPGLLASATWSMRGTESYQYNGSGITISEAPTPGGVGTPITKHQPSQPYPDAIDTDLQFSPATNGFISQLGLNAPASASCASGSFSPYCQSAAIESLTFPTMSRGDGDFNSGPPPAGRDHYMETTTLNVGRRLKKYVDTCSQSSALCDSTSPGSVTWTWTQLPGSNLLPQAEQDKRGNWTVYSYSLASGVPDAGFLLPSEMTGLYKGATASDGTNALESSRYAYTYGGTTQSPRAYEQLRTSETRPSALQSGQSATTNYVYDTAVNRLKAVIKSGYTQTFNGTTWSAPFLRYIGTFYFTRHICLNESTDDALGRTLEIHGPCLVASFNSTDCDVAPTTNIPITQYFYWPGNIANNNANRLQKVSRFAQNGGPTACSGVASLDTTYGNYDALGNPLLVTDPNGLPTTYTYEEGRVKSETTGGQTTTYSYEFGKLASIQHPQGNYEVFIHQAGGTWNGFLMEKRKAAGAVSPGLDNWSESIRYSYGSDNRLNEEEYVGWWSTGQDARGRHYYHPDGRGRTTWESDGQANVSWAAHYETKRLFDGADNLTGIGFPFNGGAPAFCGGADTNGQPVSPLCSALSYDRANRLNGLDEVPAANGATRTCLSYDVQGNVKSVVSGCPITATKGDCSQCTLPLASYQYDDFGNVISATLPWTDNGAGGSGSIRYDYDARGNVLNKQTPAMIANGDYLQRSFDGMGRELSLTHFYAQPTAGSELLYSLGYDNSATLDASCPQPSNTLGRMRYRNDSFGQTWYQYDVWGRVTKEIRLRQGTFVCSASTPNLNPHTSYTYSANGNLTSIVYPYGRTVTFNYGTFPNTTIPTDRVASIDISTYDGASWTTLFGVVSNIAWEPYGGLRGYQINHPTSSTRSAVEYARGYYNYSPLSGGCPTTSPTIWPFSYAYAFQATPMGIWVSGLTGSDTYSPGYANGSILKMNYKYSGDQVAQIDSCLLDATTPRTEVYGDAVSGAPGYDPLLRLILATRPAGNFTAVGGSFNSRAYGYDGRGNRTSETVDACAPNANVLTYGAAGHPDQLTNRSSGCASATPPSILAHNYAYDLDGRVRAKSWENDSSGNPAYALSFAYGETDGSSGGALDTVFKGVSVNGAVYNYFYDALNRRRMKVYPLGSSDEFFYDMGHQLLVDQGNDSASAAPTFHPDDNFVWLGGRPIVVVRGKMDLNFGRLADSTGDCTRNGDSAACGFYFPITDHIGKPILMLDSQRRVVGAGEYDPFGYVNRVQLHKDTVHPYPNNYSATVADFSQARAAPSLTVSMRVVLHQLDVQDGTTDSATLYDGDPPGQQLAGPYRGYHSGQVWTNWVTPSAGHLKVLFVSGPQRCCPNGLGGVDCTCPQAPNFPYTGIVAEGYQYRRYQTGTQPFWTPLGFPGQYFDSETDLFENWNRFYDASFGRYLQAEPLFSISSEIVSGRVRANAGRSMPTYVYVSNNPISSIDPDGLFECNQTDSTYSCCLKQNPNDPAKCGGNPDPVPTPKLPPAVPPYLPPPGVQPDCLECGKKRGYGCTCSCYRRGVNSGVNESHGPKVEGFGTGPDARTACKAAEDDANEKIKIDNPGETKGHCNCQSSRLN